MDNSRQTDHPNGFEVAVIGMACRFPGAENIDEFWINLQEGVESISFFHDLELKSSGIDPALFNDPNYVRAGGILKDIEWFDASFFGYNPKEAELMDPQQRLFLECAWEALENAGYDSETYDGLIGVYAGSTLNNYLLNLTGGRDVTGSITGFQVMMGNDKGHLCTRVSYKLNLQGPSVTVQTACSTSLVAVHLAFQGLLSGECDMTLAGGISINIPQKAGHLSQEGWIITLDGHCRAFDARAQGTVQGSGVGIVVLKRLTDAIADGDCIHAVIKGSAVNNDGSAKVGYTAPRIESQAKVIRAAQIMAEIEADTIGYLETHGTGTELGDPIEITALTQVFNANTGKRGFCALGSVKTNIGHLDACAGAAGLIKTILSLKHKTLPPSLHFETPNSRIDFRDSPFFVNNKLLKWKAGKTPRRAGVSSFGIGGTNAHVVLEEAPRVENSGRSRPWKLLTLSAKTSPALEIATDNLVKHLKQHPDINLADVAYTLHVGRRAFSHRRVLVCQDIDDTVSALETRNPKRVLTGVQEYNDRPVVFMFPGQGAQYVNMGLELYKVEPTFHEHVEQCAEILKSHLGIDLRDLMYPGKEQTKELSQQLDQTMNTQPSLFVMEYALARQLMSWGIQPQAMIGHSVGEYVAACLAGVFSLEDALVLVTIRGQLMQSQPGGAMFTVSLPEEEIQPKLGTELSLAAVNGTSLCVVSGPLDAVEVLQQQLTQQGLDCRRLHTSHAFHSVMMEPVMTSFIGHLKRVNLQAPRIPYLSNLTGTWITAAEATDANYWTKHLRQTVRFADGARKLLENPEWVLLEVGPGHTLSTLVRQHPQKKAAQVILSTVRHPKESQSDEEFLFNSLGRLWLAGVKVDWHGVYTRERRHRLPLPAYPFERQRYWVEHKKPALDVSSSQAPAGKKPGITDWFYKPVWEPAELPPLAGAQKEPAYQFWVVFVDDCGLGEEMVKRLEQEGTEVISIRIGEEFRNVSDNVYTINPRSCENYDTLLNELRPRIKTTWTIAHLWGVTSKDSRQRGRESFETSQYSGFYSLLFLAQAIGKQDISYPLHIGIITNNMQKVADETILYPEKSTVLGPCKVIPREYTRITCRSIDIIMTDAQIPGKNQLVDDLITELLTSSPDSIIAYRDGQRLIQTFKPTHLGGATEGRTRLREGGTYLISGGLGGMGLTFSEYLARAVKAKLILVDRLTLPVRDQWEQWLATHSSMDNVSRKIRAVQALEELGAEVMVASPDAADEDRMREVITAALDRFGEIHGVIHTAGIAGGGMIRLKTEAVVEEVFTPKVKGLYVLESILKDAKLDFVVLCSSLTSVLGEFGQVDYCAANIFLDAFALHHASPGYPFTVSINWDTWQEVGMAVETAARFGSREMSQHKEVAHPLLEKCISGGVDQVAYAAALSVKKHWVLDEHRIMGNALLPGTAYLEMARAAFANCTGSETVEIQEIFFAVPLLVKEDEIREVHTVMTKRGDGFDFIIKSRSRPGGNGDSSWQEHASGKAVHPDTGPNKQYDIKIIEKECGQNAVSIIREDRQNIEGFKESGPLTFGPRWQHLLKRAVFGANQALALLELPGTFTADLENFVLHPALVDMATAFAIKDKGVYLPFSYKKVRIYGPIPGEVYSYVKWQESNFTKKATLHFNVTIMDVRGTVLIEVEDYILRKADDTAAKFSPRAVEIGPRESSHVKDSPTVAGVQNYRLEITSPGILDTLTLRACQRRQPGPGEVEIKVHAVGLNFKDVLMALTMFPDDLSPGLTRFGSECAGEIAGVGEGVEELQVGDEVIAAVPDCFTAYITTPESFVVHKLAHLSIEEAAAIPIAFMTAQYSLFHLARLCKGERILIHSAAGGVGLAAVKLSQQTGAEIFATAGSPEKREFLRSLGIKNIMNSRILDFADEIMEYTNGRGVDVVLNSLSGEFMVKSLSTLAPFGRFLEIGKRDIYQKGQINLQPFEKGLAFFSVNLSQELPSFRSILLEVMQAFADGTLTPLPFKVFPIAEVKQAFNYMAQAKHIGKIVLSMQDQVVSPAPISAVLTSSTVDSRSQKVLYDEFSANVKDTNFTPINLKDGILSKEGVEVFKQVVDGSLPQVVVSTRDLKQRIEEQKSLNASYLLEEMEKSGVPASKQHSRPLLANEYVAPRNETERILAKIWQEVLGIDQVGIHDNFFDLGGASLQSIQVMAKAKEEGIEVAPEILFEHQTIAELVEAMSDDTIASQDEEV